MTQTVRFLITAGFLLFALPSVAMAADRFWVGGTGNWSDATNHWSDTSGGTPGAGFTPTASDNVIFDTSSSTANAAYTVTVDAAAVCLDFTMNGPGAGNIVTWAGASTLAVSGSMNLAGGAAVITRTYTGAITFNATSGTETLTSNGVGFGGTITFNGVGGTFQIADAFTSTSSITLTNGVLDTTGQSITATAISSTNANTRTLTLGASSITLTLNTNATAFDLTNPAGLTFNSNTSTITLTGVSPSFQGGGKIFNNVTYTGLNGTGAPTISGANTFNNFTVTGTAVRTGIVYFAANQTISGTFTVTGNSLINRILIRSSITGTARTLTSAAVSLSNVDFMDITAAGAASPFTGTSLGNALGSSSITFTQNSGTSNGNGGVNRYWVAAGTANWSATTSWSESSGGASGATVPLPHDTVIFDGSSGSGTRTVTCDMPRLGADISLASIAAGAVTFTNSTANTVYGSLTLAANVTPSGTNTLTFSPRSSKTLTSAGRTFTQSIVLDAPGGTITLQDALVDSRAGAVALTVNQGTFDANNFNVTLAGTTAGSFASNVATARTIRMGSGTWTLQSTGTIWNMATVTNLTLDPETSTIRVTNIANTAITFSGGGKIFNDIWFNRGGSNANIVILGSNTFNDFKDDGTTAHSILFTAGITTTVKTWSVSGTPGQLITINSNASTATHNLVKTGGGVVSADYLNIQHSIATPGTTTWYAGANSTDNQSVATAGSGWVFTAPPSVCTATTTGNWNTGSNWTGCTGVGGIPAAADNVLINSSVTITLDVNTPTVNSLGINGALDTSASNYQVNTKNLSVNSGGTLTANGSTITLSGTDGVLFTLAGTFTPGTSTVVMNGNAALTITNGAITFNNLTFSPTMTASRAYTFATGNITVSGNFDSNPSGGGSAFTLTVNLGGSFSVTGTFTLQGNNVGRTTLTTTASNYAMTFPAVTIAANSTLTTNSSSVTITGTSGTLITNTGAWSNQGAAGTTTLSGNGSANISSAALNFGTLTSSGTGTKTLGGNTTVAGVLNITNGTFACSTRTLTLSGTTGTSFPAPSGTFDAGTGVVAYTGNYAAGNTTIETSVTYYSLTLNLSGETWNPNGAINGNSAGILTVTNGELDLTSSNYAVNFGRFSIANAATAILKPRASTITLNGTGTVWSAGALTTISTSTALIQITDTSNTAITFAGGSNTYNYVWFSRVASTANITFSGDNTFSRLRDTGTAAHSLLFTAGSTTAVNTWDISGTAGNLITINSAAGSTLTHTLSKIGGGLASADYLNIQHSVATPANTWYAGTNSVDNQATATAGSGWIFTAAPSLCTAITTGTWSTGGNWSGCTGVGGVPALDENVVISAGVTITLDIDTPTVGSLGIDGTIDTSSSNYQLNSRNVSVNSGGTLTANGSTVTLSKTGGVLFTKDAAGTFNAGTSTVVVNPDSAITLVSGAVTFNNLTLNPVLTASRIYSVGTGAVTVGGNLSINPDGGGTARTLTLNLGSEGFTVNGTTTLGGTNSGVTLLDATAGNYPVTFNTLTINSGSTFTPRAGNVGITGTSGTLITNTGTWTAQTGGTTTVSGSGDATLSSAALTFYNLTFNATGTKTLTVVTTVTNVLTLTLGGLDVGSGMTHPWGFFSSSVANARTLTLNNSTINLTGTNGTIWNTATVTNFTLNSNTSTITSINTANSQVTFAGGGKIYNNIWFNRGTSTANITISGNNTFNDFQDTGTAAHSILFTNGTTNTFTTFSVNGASAAARISINSTNTATHTLTKAGGGTINCDYLNIQHSIATPANTWYAGDNCINNQLVVTAGSGWIFSFSPFNALLMSAD